MTRAAQGNPESIRARLLNRARAEGVEFQQLLTRFALERLLYRLSISDHCDQFLLKGALLFNLWYSELRRPTRRRFPGFRTGRSPENRGRVS
jgi:hypothetical protein